MPKLATTDTPPLTLAQRRAAWRADAPHSALMRLGSKAPAPGSLAMTIDTFTSERDLQATQADLEAVLEWMKNRPA